MKSEAPIQPEISRQEFLYREFLAAQVAASPKERITDDFPGTREEWRDYATRTRGQLKKCFGFPSGKCPLNARTTGILEFEDFSIEKIVFDSEPFASVTANLYLPKHVRFPVPCLIVANGHGGSKSRYSTQYAGQLYSRLGVAVLAHDTLGEEERHWEGRPGARGHRDPLLADRAIHFGRHPGGAMVYDIVRCIDYVESRPEIDGARIGLTGASLGGLITQLTAAIETRLKVAMPMAWVHHYKLDYPNVNYCLGCTRITGVLRTADQGELHALPAEQTAQFIVVGAKDKVIIDDAGAGATETVRQARKVYELFGRAEHIQLKVVPDCGHRPHQIEKPAVLFVHDFLGTPRASREQIEAMPEVLLGEWCDEKGIPIEPLYNTAAHQRGTVVPLAHVDILTEQELACLAPHGWKDPNFNIRGWIDRLEEALSVSFDIPSSRRAWLHRARRIRSAVRECLHLEGPVSHGEVEDVKSWNDSGLNIREIRFGEVNWTSFLVMDTADAASASAVIYLPVSRVKEDGADTERVKEWINENRTVLILDGGAWTRELDWDTFLGRTLLETNVKHVLEAVSYLHSWTEPPGDILCFSELRDVAILAGLADERILRVTETDGDLETFRVPSREAGILPGLGRIASRPELAAALAPRPFTFREDLEMESALEKMRAVYALFDAEELCIPLQ